MLLWYLSGHIWYLRHIVSVSNRFPWLYSNCFQSPWFQCITGIPWWLVWKGGGRCMFLKKRVVKIERGGQYTFLHYDTETKFHFLQHKPLEFKVNLNSTFCALQRLPYIPLLEKKLFLNYPILNPVYTSGYLILYLRLTMGS